MNIFTSAPIAGAVVEGAVVLQRVGADAGLTVIEPPGTDTTFQSEP